MEDSTTSTIMSLLPLAVFILVVWGIARLVSRSSAKRQAAGAGEPYGVGGVLAFYIFATCTLGPLVAIGRLSSEFRQAELKNPALVDLPAWGTYKFLSWSSAAALIAVAIWLALRLKNRLEPQSVRWTKAYLLLAPGIVAGYDAVVTTGLFDSFPGEEFAKGLLQGYVPSLIWFWYFSASKRVRNTYFGSEPLQMQAPEDAGGEAPPEPPPQVHAQAQPAPAADAGVLPDSLEGRLAKLKSWLDSGLITQQDYDQKKGELLSRM